MSTKEISLVYSGYTALIVLAGLFLTRAGVAAI